MSHKIENSDLAIESINKSIVSYGTELDRYIKLKQDYKVIKDSIQESDPLLNSTEEMEFLLDVNTGIVIALLDLAVIFKNLIRTESKWEEIYFVKQSYLSIYESLKTFSSFQRRLKEVFDSDATKSPSFLIVLQNLRNFKKKYGYDTQLALIRNKAAGHIDNDFIFYHTLIRSLEKKKTLLIIIDLLPILIKVQELTTALVQDEKQRLKLQLAGLNEQISTTLADIERHSKTEMNK